MDREIPLENSQNVKPSRYLDTPTFPQIPKIYVYGVILGPRLWEASGIFYTELIDRLIQLALERFRREQKLKTSFHA
jgi:hypothetical protein